MDEQMGFLEISPSLNFFLMNQESFLLGYSSCNPSKANKMSVIWFENNILFELNHVSKQWHLCLKKKLE